MRVHYLPGRKECPRYLLPYFKCEVSFQLEVLVRPRTVHILLELHVIQYVAVFVCTEVLRVLLHGDVGEVDKSVIGVIRVQLELVGARSQVARLANIGVTLRVEKHPDPNIELPLINQQRPLYVLLNYKAIMLILWLSLVHRPLRRLHVVWHGRGIKILLLFRGLRLLNIVTSSSKSILVLLRT